MFLSSGSATRSPLRFTGSHGLRFSGFFATTSDSDFCAPFPSAPFSLARGTSLARGGVQISQVPGKPRCRRAALSDPGGAVIAGLRDHGVAFRSKDSVGLHRLHTFVAALRGPPCSLSTLRSSGRPETTQDSLVERLPRARRDCPPGGFFRRLSRFASQFIASSSQTFPGATSAMFKKQLFAARVA